MRVAFLQRIKVFTASRTMKNWKFSSSCIFTVRYFSFRNVITFILFSIEKYLSIGRVKGNFISRSKKRVVWSKTLPRCERVLMIGDWHEQIKCAYLYNGRSGEIWMRVAWKKTAVRWKWISSANQTSRHRSATGSYPIREKICCFHYQEIVTCSTKQKCKWVDSHPYNLDWEKK